MTSAEPTPWPFLVQRWPLGLLQGALNDAEAEAYDVMTVAVTDEHLYVVILRDRLSRYQRDHRGEQ